MIDVLEKKLYEKYPSLFRDKDAPMNVTCMCWGIDCDNGWYDILDELCSELMKLKGSELIHFSQIKQKYGTLRVYVDIDSFYNSPLYNNKFTKYIYNVYLFLMEQRLIERNNILFDEVNKLIDIAEQKSAITCECCGKEGAVSSFGYWVQTLCIECKTNYNRTTYNEEN
jgi:hypothetical protein